MVKTLHQCSLNAFQLMCLAKNTAINKYQPNIKATCQNSANQIKVKTQCIGAMAKTVTKLTQLNIKTLWYIYGSQYNKQINADCQSYAVFS